MELLIPLIALVSLGFLAIRFGVDSRPAIRSDEHRLADAGTVWPSSSQNRTTPAAGLEPLKVRHLYLATVPPAQPGRPGSSFPTLRALDGARNPGLAPFATDPSAAQLEVRARWLTDRYWSERVWLTGLVDQVRFDLVCDALERERQALLEAGPRVDEVIVLPDAAPLARRA
ncbi:MAG: hypothetical protein M3490_10920 [Chloroflexota bacterium]|nr:hypothetical protein [Chloroflexota bacterium]